MGHRSKTWIHRVIAAVVVALAPLVHAQTGPEGNAHPETQVVTAAAGPLSNPFGEPDWSGVQSAAPDAAALAGAMARKQALARAVDLSPLRTLAVYHNGRVKILDTLARETIWNVVGRKNYQDLTATPDGKGATKFGYDPLFTLLDLLIDPAHYYDRPLVHVNYLPLRRLFLEAAFPDDGAKQERWLRLTRLSPRMIDGHFMELANRHGLEPGYAEALGRLDRTSTLVQQGHQNLMLVAPDAAEKPWSHLSTLAAETPARRAAADLGAAWRAGNAAGVNAAAAALAGELPKINAGIYPTTRRDLEHSYNRANAFEWGSWAYLTSLVALLLAFGTGRRWLIGLGLALLSAAILLHGAGFAARCVIAERYAIQNQFESMTGVSLFAVLVGTAVMLLKRQWLFGAAAAGVGFLVLVTATQTGIPGRFIEREAAILNTSVLLKYHVTTVLVAYGLISLGMVVGLFYLGTHYAGRWRTAAGPGAPTVQSDGRWHDLAAHALGGEAERSGPARTLHDLDVAQLTILQLAFWTLGVGVMLGAWWADHSWGRWWAFDPKETWALATWIILLITVHLRLAITGPRRALVTAWMNVLGFVVMLWTYFGVNLLLPGLHAYA